MYTVERIDPGTTAMIVVDMENDFVAPGAPMEVEAHAGRAMLPHLQRALACCREHGIPIIYTTHAHRAGGCDQGLLAHVPPIATGTHWRSARPVWPSTRRSPRAATRS